MTDDQKALKEIQDLGTQVKEKLDAQEDKYIELKSEIDDLAQKLGDGNLTEQMKTLVEDANQEYKKALEDFGSWKETSQKHMDELSAKLGRVIEGDEPKGPKTFLKALGEALENQKDEVQAYANGNSKQLKLNLKADMTTTADYTGEVIAADRLGGVFADPLRSIHIRDFLNTTTTQSDLIRYVTESAFNDQTADRAEGVAYGESDFDLTAATAPVEKIGTYMTMSKEMFKDTPFMMNYLDTRGMGRLRNREDQRILYGTGVAPQISGLTTSAAAYSDILADAQVNRIDVLAASVTQAMLNEYRPNIILLHPNDYLQTILEKDTQGNYLIPGAWSGQLPVINGARVIQNTAVTSDDFLTGDFTMGATLAIREDFNITFSDSHSTDFIDGNITVLFEERIALPIHNSNAFIYGDLSDALGAGSA